MTKLKEKEAISAYDTTNNLVKDSPRTSEEKTAPTAEMMPSSLGHEEYKSDAKSFADNNGKPREWGFSISAILMILTVLIGSIAYFVIRCIIYILNPRMMYSYTHTIIYSSIIFLTFKSLSTAHLSRSKPRM